MCTLQVLVRSLKGSDTGYPISASAADIWSAGASACMGFRTLLLEQRQEDVVLSFWRTTCCCMATIVVRRTGILLLSIASRQAPFKAEGEDTAAVRQLTQQHKTWVSAEFFAPSCLRPPAAAASALPAFAMVPSSLEVSIRPCISNLSPHVWFCLLS